MNQNKSKEQLISEAILNDKVIQALHFKRHEIYLLAIPMVVLKNGKAETIWIDEDNHPELTAINEDIEIRTQQIKNFYNR